MCMYPNTPISGGRASEKMDHFCLALSCTKLSYNCDFDSQMRFSGWNGLKVNAMIVSVKVNRLTLIPVSAFQIVMELGLSITARRSRHASWVRYRGKQHVMCGGHTS